MSKPISLRTRLAREYAGIALLTALVLGLILVFVLPPFFTQLEQTYLQEAGRSLNARLGDTRVLDSEDATALQTEIERFAQVNSVSIEILDETGGVVAEYALDDVAVSVSDEELMQPLGREGDAALLQARISGGPDAGAGIMTIIGWAWSIAGALAVAIAALFGYILAGRVSAPIAGLTRASGEMAAGDLSVRADVAGDLEVQQLGSAFNEMAEGIEDTFGSLRRFAGDAAHEIGTPLTALQADLELAQDASDDSHVRELLERSLGHSERIGKLTRDLLALSRLESVGAVVEQQRVEVTSLAEAAVDSASSRAERSGISLTLQLAGDEVWTLGDPSALSRALGNLIDNALKFTPTSGEVVVSVGREGDSALLRVVDTGLGIAEKDLPLIFERFHRSRSAAAIPGSGLGLAIVKAIVDAHRGEIGVESDPSGTVFEIRLPLAQ